jgi:D-alanyl-D-alanine carboxypeptidase
LPLALDRGLAELVETGVPGAVGLVSEGGAVEGAAFGVADLDTGRPIDVGDRVRIGSVTKTFVGTLVLKLAAEGRLDLEEELRLGSGPGELEAGVTIRRLLNHTSGLADFDWPVLLERHRTQPSHPWTPREMIDRASKPPLFPPGHGWSYSNAGYVLVGLLLEETTGITVRELLSSRILEPLGLRSTDLPEDRRFRGSHAHGYAAPGPVFGHGEDGVVDVTEVDLGGWTAGGMVSTVADVARFLGALLGGRILSPDLLAQMLTTVAADGAEWDAYGLGIAEMGSVLGVVRSPCESAWGHLGLGLGYTTVAFSTRDGSRQVVIAVNQSDLSESQLQALGAAAWSAFCG